MKLVLMLAAAGALFAQQKSVEVCWKATDAATQTCRTFAPNTITMVTVDLRQVPAQYVVVQPLPEYLVQAMQTHVTNQTYNLQQADGSLLTKWRYNSVQDLLVQYLIRGIIVPSLQLYPPTGANAGKTTFQAVAVDVAMQTQVQLVQ